MHLFYPDPGPPTTNILYEWSEISGAFALWSFMYSFVI